VIDGNSPADQRHSSTGGGAFSPGGIRSGLATALRCIAQAPSAKLWTIGLLCRSLWDNSRTRTRFCAALQLDPCSTQAAENLGALLFARGCHAEAAPLLQQSLAGANAQTRPVIEEMLAQCAASGHQPEFIPRHPFRRWDAFAASPTVTWTASQNLGQLGAHDDWCARIRRMFCAWRYASPAVGPQIPNGACALITPLRCFDANTQRSF